MTVYFNCKEEERLTNIGIAKALTEVLFAEDLKEIAEYLLVFVENNK